MFDPSARFDNYSILLNPFKKYLKCQSIYFEETKKISLAQGQIADKEKN